MFANDLKSRPGRRPGPGPSRPDRRRRAAPAPLLLAVALLLGACAQNLVAERGPQTRLAAGQAEHRLAAASLADSRALEATARRLARDYRRRGTGPVHIAVSQTVTANLEDALARAGLSAEVPVITTRLAPESRPWGPPDFALVTFETVELLRPDCPHSPGPETGWGCAVSANIADMVARPADLAGRGGAAPVDGRMAAEAIDRRRERAVDERPSLLENLQTTDLTE